MSEENPCGSFVKLCMIHDIDRPHWQVIVLSAYDPAVAVKRVTVQALPLMIGSIAGCDLWACNSLQLTSYIALYDSILPGVCPFNVPSRPNGEISKFI